MPAAVQLVVAASFILLVTYQIYQYYALRRRMPPGPLGMPLIGNIAEIPKAQAWRTYAEWHKKYGPIYSLQFGGTTIIMIGSTEVADAMLNKKGNIYSSRPRQVMIGECISQGNRILLLPYNDKWRRYHRLQGAILNPQMSKTYQALQDLESKQVVLDFLSHNEFKKNFHRYSASLTLALGYGKRMPLGSEPEIKGIDEIMSTLNWAFTQAWLVDYFPFLNVLPKWLAPWKQTAEKIRERELDFFGTLHDAALNNQAWNWTKEVSTMKESRQLTPLELSYVIGNTYEAGSDTTSIALEVFVLAAVLHPEKMRTAQAEIDRVVGRERLPNFDDKLPYVDAIIQEVHRWRPVIPGGVPHAVIQDDEFMGYHIPKNAMVFGNHWAISMNADTYTDPEAFNPDRWIENPGLAPPVTFGFGRRVCIGESHLVSYCIPLRLTLNVCGS
jgi:cytochrome P450